MLDHIDKQQLFVEAILTNEFNKNDALSMIKVRISFTN